MNNTSTSNRADDDFTARLNQHPALKARVSSILDIAENTSGDVIKADDAEKQTIEALRQLGNDLLHEWAHKRITQSSEKLRNEQPSINSNGKKNSNGIQATEILALKSDSLE